MNAVVIKASTKVKIHKHSSFAKVSINLVLVSRERLVKKIVCVEVQNIS